MAQITRRTDGLARLDGAGILKFRRIETRDATPALPRPAPATDERKGHDDVSMSPREWDRAHGHVWPRKIRRRRKWFEGTSNDLLRRIF
jgi:hypothetical protein